MCIVGGGPAGLSAAIKIMQLAKEQGNEEFRVVVLEKGGEVGQSALLKVLLQLRAIHFPARLRSCLLTFPIILPRSFYKRRPHTLRGRH